LSRGFAQAGKWGFVALPRWAFDWAHSGIPRTGTMSNGDQQSGRTALCRSIAACATALLLLGGLAATAEARKHN
jgi:hypothetical protein